MYFRAVKAHYGIKGQKQRKPRYDIPTKIKELTGERIERIPLHEHPGFLILFAFLAPELLSQQPGHPNLGAYLIPTPLYRDTEQRSAKHSHKAIILGENLEPHMLGRLLAKIGHSFATAELGATFKPYLNNIITDYESNRGDLGRYVGGKPSEAPPAGKLPPAGRQRHEIAFEPVFWKSSVPGEPAVPLNLVVVRIRLFAELGGPVHYVVAGERI